MGYMPRDRQEEDALTLYRVQDMAADFICRLRDELGGAKCALFPAMKPAVDAIADAIEEFDVDVVGQLRDLDPYGGLASTARMEAAERLLSQARNILPIAAE